MLFGVLDYTPVASGFLSASLRILLKYTSSFTIVFIFSQRLNKPKCQKTGLSNLEYDLPKLLLIPVAVLWIRTRTGMYENYQYYRLVHIVVSTLH
jgi:hypothetical protein